MSAVRVGRSRRRPVRTTGTLPPEGSRAAMDRGNPLPIRQWPITLVLAVVGIGLGVTFFAHGQFRYGVLTIGGGLLLGALLRLLVPEVGMLAVRSRFTDVLLLAFLGTVIIVLALLAQPDPWLRIHVLEDFGRYVGRKH